MIEKMMPGAESQAAEFTHLVVTMLLLIVTTHTLSAQIFSVKEILDWARLVNRPTR